MIDLKTLKQLVKLMSDNDLTELDIHDGEEKVKLKRGGEGGVQFLTPPPAPQAIGAAVPPPAATTTGDAAAPGGDADDEAGLLKVPSPMVGTFYSAASPDSKPFVNVGDQIDSESVVCIIEAMKVFNEIQAECKGTIHKMCVSDGQAVEFGQTLFLVKP